MRSRDSDGLLIGWKGTPSVIQCGPHQAKRFGIEYSVRDHQINRHFNLFRYEEARERRAPID